MTGEPNGIINLDKPAGISSARAVSAVKRLLPRGTKIGHAGTLDPFATGVLLLLVGKATKACERLMDSQKQYDAAVRFGATTATDDPEAPAVPWTPTGGGAVGPVSVERIRAALPAFVGEIRQRPPAFSAMKVGGRRAYDLAQGSRGRTGSPAGAGLWHRADGVRLAGPAAADRLRPGDVYPVDRSRLGRGARRGRALDGTAPDGAWGRLRLMMP